jgi:glycosyltransferase involved in cell wall biosynthesis
MTPKVLHVIVGLNSGGAENVLLRLCKGLKSEGIENHIVTLKAGGSLEKFFIEEGISVSSLEIKNIQTLLAAPFRLRRMIRALRPNIVQSWMYHADFLCAVTRLIGTKFRLFWNIRHSDLRPDSSKRLTRFIARSCALLSWFIPEKIVCVAHVAARAHKDIGYCSRKFVVIPNGIDTKRFAPSVEARATLRQELKIDENQSLIGMVARYNPQKDHPNFIKMARLLRNHRDNTKFLLCGRGINWQNKELIGLIQGLGMEKDFVLLEERPDVENVYPALDLHVLSSKSGEGFPNVVAEAMACGVPSIATDCGDAKLIIGMPALVAQKENAEGLAECAISALDDRAQDRHHDRIQKYFSLESFCETYFKIYTGET